MIGWALRQFGIWTVLGLVLYLAVDRLLLPLAEPAASPASDAVAPSPAVSMGTAAPNSLMFRANRQGHVVLEAAVNGTPVHFLVDTGATFVVLTRADAAAAGIATGLVYNVRTATANGVARAASVKLRELRIGQFSASDVPALVGENMAGVSLLGQSFLRRLDSYEVRDGTLTLNWN